MRRQPAANITVAVSSALAYAFIAVASNFVTKLAGLLMPGAPDVVLAGQLATMLGVMHGARSAGWLDWAPTTASRVFAFMPQSLAYGAHAALVLRALSMLNVPIYNTLKRMTPIIVLCAKVVLDRKLPGLGITGSVVLTVMGCVVAGLGDLSFEMQSYMVALGAAAVQATYILLTEYASPSGSAHGAPRVISLSQFSLIPPTSSAYSQAGTTTTATTPLSPSAEAKSAEAAADSIVRQPGHARLESGSLAFELPCLAFELPSSPIPASLRPAASVAAESMFYAALTCLPLAVGVAVMTGQFDVAQAALMQGVESEVVNGSVLTLAAWLLVILNMEWLLTGSLVVCTQTNSALTTTVVGVLKGIIAVVLGFFLLGGVGPQGMSWTGIMGITMNCAGGVWYAAVKWRESAASSIKPARN